MLNWLINVNETYQWLWLTEMLQEHSIWQNSECFYKQTCISKELASRKINRNFYFSFIFKTTFLCCPAFLLPLSHGDTISHPFKYFKFYSGDKTQNG